MPRFEGVKLSGGEVRYGREGGSTAGAVARVETAGEVERRFTATRLALLGPFALAFKKKKDKRELYLTVEGPGYAFVVEIPPKKGTDARKFAAQINSASSKSALPSPSLHPAGIGTPSPPPPPPQTPAVLPPQVAPRPPTPPPSWLPDPLGRHQHRYWDGAQWTSHVADGGHQSVDPLG